MRNHLLGASFTMVILALAALGVSGCSQSRVELLKERSALIEQKLVTERDRALADAGAAERESRMSHLQSLRLGLSMVNVSIASVPLMLTTEAQRDVGYSVLDEALGTIDWNIPLHDSASVATRRPYPTLFSPQTGLNFSEIRRADAPAGSRP